MATELPQRESWWRRMSRKMDRASLSFSEQVKDTILLRRDLDDEFYEDLTELLLSSDVGAPTTDRLVIAVKERVRENKLTTGEEAVAALKTEMEAMFATRDRAYHRVSNPSVILMVGVNGSGKTTTTGKLAHRLREEGHTPLLAAADTFRAAAIEQLKEWGARAHVDVVAHQPGGDPGAVAYDAIEAATARGCDTVIVDTAGRLHTKVNLMAEIEKVSRVIRRLCPEGADETLLVLEAPTGMNAISQAKAFHQSLKLTGLVLTKLDGSSRGGTVIAIEEELGVPVKFVGLGEGIDDLNVFDPKSYLDALFHGLVGEETPAP